jgi:hypothetical protein
VLWNPVFGETATIVRPGAPTKDAYGNQVPGPAVETAVHGVVWAPLSSSENMQGQDLLKVSGTMYWPPDTDVRYTDKVRFRGDTYLVYGQSGQVIHPRTGTHGPASTVLQLVM